MAKRLITSAIGIVIFFLILPSPQFVFNIAIGLITLIGSYELSNAVTKNMLLKAIGVLSWIGVYIATLFSKQFEAMICVISLYLILTVLLFGKEELHNLYLLALTSAVFPMFFATLSLLKRDFSGYAVLLPFLFAWITDSGAYFTGIYLGKHKLAKTLSPKKTIEGSVGGIVSCVIASIIYMIILKNCFHYFIFNSHDYLKIIIMSILASVVSQFGDLSLSAIKRVYKVKDYGNLLPGHGGVLDRFDSVLFVSPFVFWLLTILK